MSNRIFNKAGTPGTVRSNLGATFAFRNEADETKPLEILVYEEIGKDFWTGEGMDAKGFIAKLDGINRNRDIELRVNSRGGDVFEGLAIYNRLNDWEGNVLAKVDGIAASIASILIMAADEVHMPASSQMFIHDAWTVAAGNADDFVKVAAELNTTSDLLAGIYAEKTGRTKEEVRAWMREAKLMNGDEAKALGFADKVTEGQALYNFSPEDISTIRAMCRAGSHNKQGGKPTIQQKEPQMNRNAIIALLNKRGVTVDDKATDEQLMEQLNALLEPKNNNADELAAMRASIEALTKQRDAERKDRITRTVDRFVIEDRIPAEQAAKWVTRAMADESVLTELAALPAKPPGQQTNTHTISAEASVADKTRHFGKLNPVTRAQFFKKNQAEIIQFCAAPEFERMMNAAGDNTVATGLKRQVILQAIVRAFASKIFPLSAFSTVFNNIALDGLDTIEVPYFALETAASTAWSAANGYVAGTTTTDVREITIDKRQYQAAGLTSSELRRQPFLNTLQLMQLKAEKLGVDVFTDVLSVVTLANYGAAVVAEAASAFDSDDVATLRGAAASASWPEVGRSLFLQTDYDTALHKDSAIKNSGAFNGNVAQTGVIPQIMGFKYFESSSIPNNSENLMGFIAMPSAILFASSPIRPTDAVMQQTALYEVVVDADTGIAMEHRVIGNALKDNQVEVIEANYGYQYGEKAGLKRITT